MTKIYTKSGDKGITSLYNGERVSKTNIIFDCLGDIDTCNAFIGLSIEYLTKDNQIDKEISNQLEDIMHILLSIGSYIATPRDNSSKEKLERTCFDKDKIILLENEIDKMTSILPQLKNFVLCGGGKFASHIHVCRTFVRSLERRLLKLNIVDVNENNFNINMYVNRLSDYLFTLARYYSIVIVGNSDKIHKIK